MPDTARDAVRSAVRDVAAAADPVAAVLAAHAAGTPIALRTSGTTSRPRSVVRTTESWFDSFGPVSGLTGIDRGARVWVPGPLAATMNLFAATHARFVGADVVTTPDRITHACLTPTALVRCLDDGVDLGGVHVVVAGSFRSGDGLSSAPIMMAASATVRVIGPLCDE
jgi:hypothetical protein